MNLPNKITLTRICMIPIFLLVFFLNGLLPFAYGFAAIIFALAAFTDFLDGYIARSKGMVTNLGKFLDPIADKVLVSTAMILLLTMQHDLFGYFASWIYIVTAICVCIILARELIISAFRQIAAANNVVMAADKLGKVKTLFQDVAIFTMIFSAGFEAAVVNVLFRMGFVLFLVATVLTVWSGISYVVNNKKVLKDK